MVVGAQRCHFWSDTPVLNKTDELVHCHGGAVSSQITKIKAKNVPVFGLVATYFSPE